MTVLLGIYGMLCCVWLLGFLFRSEHAATHGAMGHVWRRVRGRWQWVLKSECKEMQ